MKKLVMGFMLSAGLFLAGTFSASAQQKFGYFDVETVLGMMPGIERVDTALMIFERDSLAAEYQFELAELQRQDSTLRADSVKMPARLYQQRQQEQAQRFVKLQQWQQYSNQLMQAKQQELLAPYYQKVLDAFRKVKDQGKYTYVFRSDALYDAPQGDNMIPLVAKELGIKMPEQPAAPATR